MKIIMVNKFLYPKGGAETYFLKIGQYLQDVGHTVEYFGMHDEKNTVGNSLGLYTGNMDFRKRSLGELLYPLHILYSVEARSKLEELIRTFRPDIIHLNNINFQLTPSVIDAAARHGVPMVQTVHDFQMLCPNHMLLDVKNRTPCERCVVGSPLHCTLRSCIHASLPKSILGTLEAYIYRHRDNYARVKRYICPSLFLEQMLLRREVYRGKTEVLHNFIDTKSPKLIEKKGYVLYFGRLSPEKGIDMLLGACRRLPDIPFVIAGSGPLEAMCSECGLPNVTYVGFKEGQELESLIAQAEFSVYLPIWYENCPLSVLESQSYGTPVLATYTGGIPELVEDGVDGRLLRSWNEESCAQEIEKLWSDKGLLSTMQQNCLNKKSMTLERYVERLLGIYEECLDERREKLGEREADD